MTEQQFCLMKRLRNLLSWLAFFNLSCSQYTCIPTTTTQLLPIHAIQYYQLKHESQTRAVFEQISGNKVAPSKLYSVSEVPDKKVIKSPLHPLPEIHAKPNSVTCLHHFPSAPHAFSARNVETVLKALALLEGE